VSLWIRFCCSHGRYLDDAHSRRSTVNVGLVCVAVDRRSGVTSSHQLISALSLQTASVRSLTTKPRHELALPTIQLRPKFFSIRISASKHDVSIYDEVDRSFPRQKKASRHMYSENIKLNVNNAYLPRWCHCQVKMKTTVFGCLELTLALSSTCSTYYLCFCVCWCLVAKWF